MLNGNVCQSVSWGEGVFVVIYFGFGGRAEDNRNDIETEGAVPDIICREKIAGGSE